MRFRRPKVPPEPACKHTFDIVGANLVKVMDPYTSKDIPIETRTDVLKVCAWCGTHKVEAVRGHWTLEQLRGLNPTAAPVEDA